MTSLSSLSEYLKTAKMNILNHYSKIIKKYPNLVKHTYLKDHVRYFDDKLVKVLVKSFDNSRAKYSSVLNKDVLMEKIKAQKIYIHRLEKESDTKDHQIAKQNNNIDKFSQLLNQQQRLQATTKADADKSKQKIARLQDHVTDPAKEARKDAHIKKQDQRIKRLSKLLDRQQKLQLDSQSNVKDLKARIKKMADNSSNSKFTMDQLKKTIDKDSKLIASSKHKTLWQRIFNK